jgi:hypothetical protein
MPQPGVSTRSFGSKPARCRSCRGACWSRERSGRPSCENWYYRCDRVVASSAMRRMQRPVTTAIAVSAVALAGAPAGIADPGYPTPSPTNAAPSPTVGGQPDYFGNKPDARGNPACGLSVGWDTFYDGDTGLHGTRVVFDKQPTHPITSSSCPMHTPWSSKRHLAASSPKRPWSLLARRPPTTVLSKRTSTSPLSTRQLSRRF